MTASSLESAAFRDVTEQCLRHFAAYMMEAHMVREHTEIYRSRFRRGQENSPIDAGYLPATGEKGHVRFVSTDAKTLVVTYRPDSRKDASKCGGPIWRGVISYEENQLGCDFWSVYFPLLRNPNRWRAILNPRGSSVHRKASRVVYQYAEAGQRIDHVVPANLWPSIGSIKQSAQVITALSRSATNLQDGDESDFMFDFTSHYGHPPTAETLRNPRAQREHALIEFIHGQLAAHQGAFEVVEPMYHPYTCDLAFRHKVTGAVAFVELKMGHCRVEEDANDRGQVVVRHRHAHQNEGCPIFTYSSGRWSYMISTYGPDSLKLENGLNLPSTAVVRHREDVPDQWWYGEPNLEEELISFTSKISLFTFEPGFASRLEETLSSDLQRSRFGLPPLEIFTMRNQGQIRQLYRHLNSTAKTRPRIDTSNSSSRPDYKYQASQALDFLHACRDVRKGLIFDWQYKYRALRMYAVSSYDWSSSDMLYTSRRPRRLPIEIFEQPSEQPYILISFCRVRQDTSDDHVYVHPFVLRDLHTTRNGFGPARRILLMTTEDTVQDRSVSSPVYAVPVEAIHYDLPLAKNWSRMIKLRLKSGEDLEQYKFNSFQEFITHLVEHLRGMRLEHRNTSDLVFGGHSVWPTSRKELFNQIRHQPDKDQEDIESEDELSDDDFLPGNRDKRASFYKDWTLA